MTYYFINDNFNFENDAPLGLWWDAPFDTAHYDHMGRSFLHNNKFRNIKKYGYGQKFPVLSRLRPVEDFKPYCFPYILEKNK